MKVVVDKYAIDKTQVDYILKSDKEYLYLSNALEYTRINIKSNINRYLRAHMCDTTYINVSRVYSNICTRISYTR